MFMIERQGRRTAAIAARSCLHFGCAVLRFLHREDDEAVTRGIDGRGRGRMEFSR